MQVRNSESHVVFVYTWNPDWQTFKNKSLEDKIEAFESIVREAATDFENKSAIDQNSISLVIAPENIFSPSSCQGGQEAYSAKEHQLFQDKLQALSRNVSERVLIISGAICYFSADLDSYKITSYLISKNRMDSYDKKKSTGPIRSGDRVVPMMEGKKPGIFEFDGLRIGLEICLDHEERVLREEAGNNPVHIHVLICNGQNIRQSNIATSSKNDGLFVVCELEGNKNCGILKTLESTQCYMTQPVIMREQTKTDSTGNNWRYQRMGINAEVLGSKVLTTMQAVPMNAIGTDICCAVTAIPLNIKSPVFRHQGASGPRLLGTKPTGPSREVVRRFSLRSALTHSFKDWDLSDKWFMSAIPGVVKSVGLLVLTGGEKDVESENLWIDELRKIALQISAPVMGWLGDKQLITFSQDLQQIIRIYEEHRGVIQGEAKMWFDQAISRIEVYVKQRCQAIPKNENTKSGGMDPAMNERPGRRK